MTTLGATAALLVLAALAVLQVALAAGAPLGRLAWGGSYDVLPRRLRIGSAVAVLLYGGFAAFLVSGAGMLDVITHDALLRTGLWVITAYLLVGTVANAASRSWPEQVVMTPAAAVLTLGFALVALEA